MKLHLHRPPEGGLQAMPVKCPCIIYRLVRPEICPIIAWPKIVPQCEGIRRYHGRRASMSRAAASWWYARFAHNAGGHRHAAARLMGDGITENAVMPLEIICMSFAIKRPGLACAGRRRAAAASSAYQRRLRESWRNIKSASPKPAAGAHNILPLCGVSSCPARMFSVPRTACEAWRDALRRPGGNARRNLSRENLTCALAWLNHDIIEMAKGPVAAFHAALCIAYVSASAEASAETGQ